MKKTFVMVLLVLFWTVSVAGAAALKIGDKVSALSLKDSAEKVYTLDAPPYAGKVVAVLYTDKASADKNGAIEAKMKAANIDDKTYKSMPVLNLKDTPLPNFVLKKAILKKQEEIKSPILIDENYGLVGSWGLNKKAYNIVLIDKSRTVRFIYRGGERAEVPAAEIDKLIGTIKEYQVK